MFGVKHVADHYKGHNKQVFALTTAMTFILVSGDHSGCGERA
jgi:hypothetical protein